MDALLAARENTGVTCGIAPALLALPRESG